MTNYDTGRRFPDGWERGHEAKYWVQTGLTPCGLTLDPERAPGVLNWLGVNYYTPDSPYRPQPAAVVLPAQWLADLQRADIYAITTRIEEQLAHMSDEVTLTAIEAEQTLRALRIHLLMIRTEDDLR